MSWWPHTFAVTPETQLLVSRKRWCPGSCGVRVHYYELCEIINESEPLAIASKIDIPLYRIVMKVSCQWWCYVSVDDPVSVLLLGSVLADSQDELLIPDVHRNGGHSFGSLTSWYRIIHSVIIRSAFICSSSVHQPQSSLHNNICTFVCYLVFTRCVFYYFTYISV